MEIKVQFKFQKETKGTFRYEEVPAEGKPPIVGTFYLRKYAITEGSPKPERLELTIKGVV